MQTLLGIFGVISDWTLLAYAAVLAFICLIWRNFVPNTGQNISSGNNPSGNINREDHTLAVVISQAHGKYVEGSIRGQLFSASDQGTGITPGSALGTTAAFVLLNPLGSNKVYAIQKVSMAYISGTLGAGAVMHCSSSVTTQTVSSGTGLTVASLNIGSGATSKATANIGGTVTQPVVIRPFASTFAELATTANGIQLATEDIDGEILLQPGCSYQLQGIMGAAGTSPKVSIGCTWEEYPLPSSGIS